MRRRGNGERAEMKFLAPLIKFLGKYRAMLLISIILSVCGTILTIIGPKFVSQIADILSASFYGDVDLEKVGQIGTLLVVLYSLAFIFSYFQGFMMNTVTQRTAYNLRKGICAKINILPLNYFDNHLIGDVLSRVVNDVDTIGHTLNQSIGNLFNSTTQFFGVMIIMFATNWVLTLVAFGAAIIGFIFMTVIMKNSQKFFDQSQQLLGTLNGYAEEMISGQTIVRAYNAEQREYDRFNDVNTRYRGTVWKSMFCGSTMQPIMGFVGNFGYVAVCIVGAVMVAKGSITFGTVVAFMMYIRYFTAPMQQLGQVFTQLQSAAAASKRVFAFLDEEELPYDMDKPVLIPYGEAKGNIVFEHVKFGYNPEKIIIHDFSAEAKAGQKIAIVGPTGAGKTTMVNLLMRFYELDDGRITIDGHPISEMRREEVHALFGMVLQDTWLFEGSFKENIKYSKEATDEQVVEAAKMAGIHHFIMTTADGYDTILDEEANVSQGQKQLITIARAMVEDAPFLILDEATSSVDTRTEHLIQEAMDRLMAGRTSFIIAHRLSTIKNADLILVMKDGDIIEQGNHAELMEQNGFYADLYNSQFEAV